MSHTEMESLHAEALALRTEMEALRIELEGALALSEASLRQPDRPPFPGEDLSPRPYPAWAIGAHASAALAYTEAALSEVDAALVQIDLGEEHAARILSATARRYAELAHSEAEGAGLVRWVPGVSEPFSPDARACSSCRAWVAELESADSIDRLAELDIALADHAQLHQLVTAALDGAGAERAGYLSPQWEETDGHPTVREPAACAGVTEYSKAFFLLNRHRFGRFALALMRDAGGDLAGPAGLYLHDDHSRVMHLRGMTAGYHGEGPHGTLWILRRAGFPEHKIPAGRGLTNLERLVYSEPSFLLSPARLREGQP